MNFNPDSRVSTPEVLNFKLSPIEDVSLDLRHRFTEKDWENIAIEEPTTSEPKPLEVIPNIPLQGRVMAWPAYYKTVKKGSEGDGQKTGFGELAQAIPGRIQSSPIVKVRPEIKSRLDRAQRMLDSNLQTANLQLVVVDGYRRIAVQKQLFDGYYEHVVAQNPGQSAEGSRTVARKMVAEPPKDIETLKQSPPPHSTGGSVDMILVFKDKIKVESDHWLEEAMVPFGAGFDEMMHPVHRDERSETIFYERKLQEEGSLTSAEQTALEYRRILWHTLTQTGFSNYSPEFWHYDFGNQFHALATGKQSAEFGFAGGVANGQIIENLDAERAAFAAYAKIHGSIEAEQVKDHFGLN